MLTTLIASFWTRRAIAREDGQAIVEYALILALVAIAAITVLGLIGAAISGKLGELSRAL